jgi:hypothetical protein
LPPPDFVVVAFVVVWCDEVVDGGWVTGAGAGVGLEFVVGAGAGVGLELVVGAGDTPPEAEAVVAVLWCAGLCFLWAGSAFFLVVAVVGVVAAAVCVELEREAVPPPQPAIATAAATANRDVLFTRIPPRTSLALQGTRGPRSNPRAAQKERRGVTPGAVCRQARCDNRAIDGERTAGGTR